MNSKQLHRILPILACLVASAAVDLAYFPPHTVFPDEQRFLSSAIRLATDGQFWVGADRAWEMPGAALFFAPFVRLFGADGVIIPIRLCQALLLAAQCALVAFIAGAISRDRLTAIVAAWMVALYPFLLYYQGLLLSETLFNTLLLAGVAALYGWRRRGLRIDAMFIVGCACFAAATYVKATLTVLPPALFAVTAWTAGATWRRSATVLLAAACLYAGFLSPWWIRNAVLLDHFVPFTTSSALNLYLGNNPHNREAGIDWRSDVEPEVVTRIAALPDEIARQHAFSKAATDYIKAHPDIFLQNAARKFVRFWNVVPNAAEFSGWTYAAISLASFGPVLLLAIVGVLRGWRSWRQLTPILFIIGYFTVVHSIAIASLRYRLPLEPLLIALAAGLVAALLTAAAARLRPQSYAARRAP